MKRNLYNYHCYDFDFLNFHWCCHNKWVWRASFKNRFFPTDLKPNLVSQSCMYDLLWKWKLELLVQSHMLCSRFHLALTNQFESSETYFLSVRTTNWTQTRRLPVRVRRGLSQKGGQSRLSSCCLVVTARGECDSDVSQNFQDHGPICGRRRCQLC